jgi:hypothetical protein
MQGTGRAERAPILDHMDERRPLPGVRAYLDLRRPPMHDGLVPVSVTHATAGLRWEVREVLDHWQHRDGMRARPPAVNKAWKLRVTGPLPGRPQENGEFEDARQLDRAGHAGPGRAPGRPRGPS